ncbi:MAG: bifunctional sugar-1-phosphate nucleotidylyltransferase/acetyltransferase, partial [Candidatus Baldrarchaeia archaeon]
TPKIFKAIKQTKKSKRGEYELTDSIQQLIKQGENILAYELEDWWIDIGTPWDLLDANKLLLEETKLEIKGKIEEGAKIIGPVGIGENTVIRSGSYIIGPTLIGKNCDIGPNCFIRPHTYIGNHCRIGNACEIKNSIILDHTHIAHLSYVGDSIIGQNVNFGAGTITANLRLDEKTIKMTIKGKRIDTGRRKLGAIIGDNVKTGIGCMLMPGIKIGQNSLIGPNTTINKDIPPNTITTTKPQNTTKPLQPQPKK